MRSRIHSIILALFLGLAALVLAESLTYTGRPRVEAPVHAISSRAGLQMPGELLRVCSYNIENFTDGKGDGRKRNVWVTRRQAHKAAALLDEIRPHIVVLQEIENADALKALNASMDDPFPVGYVTRFERATGGGDKLNLAVLSRFPLKGVREIDFGPLEGVGRPPRGVLSFYVELGGRHRLLAYVVHLKSNWGEKPRNRARRAAALQIVRNDADALRRRYAGLEWETVVVGDMNVDPDARGFEDDPSLAAFSDWKDLWRGQPAAERVTLPTRYGDPAREFPPVAFDRFIVSQELTAMPWVATLPRALPKGVDTRNVKAEPGHGFVHVSDHYPVYLDFLRQ